MLIRMYRVVAAALSSTVILVASVSNALAQEFDPFATTRSMAASPAKTMISATYGESPCQFGEPKATLQLIEVVERALCHSPQTRQAWANAKYQAALVGVRQSAYLPTINVSIVAARQNNSTRVTGFPELDADSNPTIRTGSLKMTWVLSDSGLRRSNLEQARALLDAANAVHDDRLQSAFLNAAQIYYDSLTAVAALDASREAEKAAKESLMAAEAKYKAGVGGLTDQLQASTAYSQAKLERVIADGELKNVHGSLAMAIGLAVNTSFVLAKPEDHLPDTAFVKPIEALLEDARRYHPSVVAAQAEMHAALAKVYVTKAEGKPSISLASEISRSDQLGQPPTLGLTSTDTTSTSSSIGIQVNIPLFEGFGRTYQIQAAQSQVEAKEAEYAQVEQQVLLEVWKNYQLLETESEGLKTTAELVNNARASFDVARGRYKSGVGNIVELLNVQSALAKAEQQRIKTISNWHNARLKLAASVGKIGLWAITGLPQGSAMK
ncbi:MAG: TolC family protein [Hydrogenophilales bacterium]|nr:TolC family protein [Hydrogenophilales bacterium]